MFRRSVVRRAIAVCGMVPAAALAQARPEPSVPNLSVPKVTSLTPRAGPFGIYKGMSKAELQNIARIVPLDTGLYSLTRVPNPHSAFTSYAVAFTERLGVCKVFATTSAIQTNNFGTQLRSEFNDIAEALETKYGRHITTDNVKSGSLWDEPRDWMMGLLKKDRTFATIWESTPATPLPDGISAIGLEALASSTDTGALRLTYDFDTVKSCVAEINKKKNSVF
jgi:hypothetical protein